MQILYVAHKYDYGDPTRGFAFEHFNFYESLIAAGHDVLYFDFPSIAQNRGCAEMNRRLREIVVAEKPELMFTFVWGDLLNRKTIRWITHECDTVTLNWYCDDHWRFEALSRRWTPCFNWVVTTAEEALPKYEALGYTNVIKSQWACNPAIYKRDAVPKQYDVSFVGLPHSRRRELIHSLRSAGMRVHTFGKGWPVGRVTQDEMIRIFNESRVNLNFCQASTAKAPSWTQEHVDRYLWSPMLRAPLMWRAANCKMHRTRAHAEPGPKQVKARVFEVTGCGGCLVTDAAENLREYYLPEQEIVMFHDTHELIEKVRWLLDHEDERAAIAEAGYERTLRDHTYQHRFADIFARIGLSHATGRATNIHDCSGRMST